LKNEVGSEKYYLLQSQKVLSRIKISQKELNAFKKDIKIFILPSNDNLIEATK
jgi:hypothetical protein